MKRINDLTADCNLIVHGQLIRVHRSLLQRKSQRFEILLSGRWENPELNEYTYRIIKKYLHFLYYDKVKITVYEFETLYNLALSYYEPKFKKFIERQLLKMYTRNPKIIRVLSSRFYHLIRRNATFTCDNVLTFLHLAIMKSDSYLKKRCQNFFYKRNCYEHYVSACKSQNAVLIEFCNMIIPIEYIVSFCLC